MARGDLTNHKWACAGAAAADTARRVPTVSPLAADGTWASLKTHVIAVAELDDDINWDAQVDATTVRTHQHAAGARKEGLSSTRAREAQAIGRSRGGLTTTIRTLADGRGRSLATRIQAAGSKVGGRPPRHPRRFRGDLCPAEPCGLLARSTPCRR